MSNKGPESVTDMCKEGKLSPVLKSNRRKGKYMKYIDLFSNGFTPTRKKCRSFNLERTPQIISGELITSNDTDSSTKSIDLYPTSSVNLQNEDKENSVTTKNVVNVSVINDIVTVKKSVCLTNSAKSPDIFSNNLSKCSSDFSSSSKSKDNLTPAFNDSVLNSQFSCGSTQTSQPLIERIQNRINGLSDSVISVKRDIILQREEAVQAVLKEYSSKHHEEFQLGPFFGLPSKVAELLKLYRGIEKLYDWQVECIETGRKSNGNLLISLPTSGGKTLVAELLLLREVLLNKKDAIFILPYIAVVQEKVRGLSPFGVELNFIVEEYAGSKGIFPPKKRRKRCIYIATIEKGTGLINSLLENKRIEEVGLAVIDEAHMVGESGGRGMTLESTVTKMLHSAKNVRLLAMSATIGNLKELADFFNAEVFTREFRPVELKEYIKYTREQKRIDPDGIAALVKEAVPDHSCLVFCPTKRNCEALSEVIIKILCKPYKQINVDKKKALLKALMQEGGGAVCPILKHIIPYGLAYHHSGLTEAERKLIEEGYLSGTLCCIVCTSTLAAGVNLPARRVIVRSPFTGRELLSKTRYHQMVGRAGRAGMDTLGESFLILQDRDIKKVSEMLLSPMDSCLSSLGDSEMKGLKNLVFSSLGLGLIPSFQEAQMLVQKTLYALQLKNEETLNSYVKEILENLRLAGFVRIKSKSGLMSESSEPCEFSGNLTGSSGIEPNFSSFDAKEKAYEVINRSVMPDDILVVSRLGRASIKGNIDLSIANLLYVDLLKARETLAVHTYFHLLYLVTPYSIAELVPLIPNVFYDAYGEEFKLAPRENLEICVCVLEFVALKTEEVEVARLLGISEAVLVKVSMGQQSKKCDPRVLRRFNAAMMLFKMLNGGEIWEVSKSFHVDRGVLQQSISATSAFCSCVYHFCQELEELWAFRDLLASFCQQVSGCCSAELLPLMELPAVKLGRAKLMYNAGYCTLIDIANAKPQALVSSVHHLPYRTAVQMVNSAKMILLEKADSLQEEAEEVLRGLCRKDYEEK